MDKYEKEVRKQAWAKFKKLKEEGLPEGTNLNDLVKQGKLTQQEALIIAGTLQALYGPKNPFFTGM